MILSHAAQSAKTEALELVKKITVRADGNPSPDLDQDRVADLKNTTPFYDFTADGIPVAALALPADFSIGRDEPLKATITVLLAIATLPVALAISWILPHLVALPQSLNFVVSVAIATLALSAVFEEAIWAALLLILSVATGGLALVLYAFLLHPTGITIAPKGEKKPFYVGARHRSLQYLAAQASVTARLDFLAAKESRAEQFAGASQDNSPLVDIAVSRGDLAATGDRFASDPRQIMRLSLSDLQTGMVIMGSTGSGKTVAIRKLVAQLGDAGMLVVDGKGELPASLRSTLPRLRLIRPGHTTVAPLQGLSVIEAVESLCPETPGQKDGKFFEDQARLLVRNCIALAFAAADATRSAGDYQRNLRTVYGILVDADCRSAALATIADDHALRDVTNYFTKQLPSLQAAETTFAGIYGHASNWIEPLMTAPAMGDWLDAENGVDFSEVCTGQQIGLDLVGYPKEVVAVLANLVRDQVTNALTRRGDAWQSDPEQKRVALIIDEMHLVWRERDSDTVSTVRSRGGMFVCATQSIDELISRFGGKEKAYSVVSNLRNMICFTASAATLEFASDRLGHCLRQSSTIRDEHQPRHEAISTLGQRAADAIAAAGADERQRKVILERQRMALSWTRLKSLVPFHDDAVEPTSDALYRVHHVASPEELSALLTQRFAAAVAINRAGSPRRSIGLVRPQKAA